MHAVWGSLVNIYEYQFLDYIAHKNMSCKTFAHEKFTKRSLVRKHAYMPIKTV